MICIIVFILRSSGMIVDYTTLVGMVAIGIGGVSSALWGTIICRKVQKIQYKENTERFFRCKTKILQLFICAFILVIGFLLCCV